MAALARHARLAAARTTPAFRGGMLPARAGACRGARRERDAEPSPRARRYPWEVLDPDENLSTTAFDTDREDLPRSLVFKHIPDEEKWAIYRHYKENPTPETVSALARQHRLERPRVEMIIKMKQMGEDYIARGFVPDDAVPPEVLVPSPADPSAELAAEVAAAGDGAPYLFDEWVSDQKEAWLEDQEGLVAGGDGSFGGLTTDYADGADSAHRDSKWAPRIMRGRILAEDEVWAPPPPLSRQEAEEFDADRRRRRSERAREARRRSAPVVLERMRVAEAGVLSRPPAPAGRRWEDAPAPLRPFGRAAAPRRRAPWRYAMLDMSVRDAAALVRDEHGRLRLATDEEEACLSWNKPAAA